MFQFVEAMITMAQVNMKEWCFWDRLDWLFIFLVWGCCGIGDGMKLLDNKDKKTSCQETKYLIYLYNLDNKLDFLAKIFQIYIYIYIEFF